MDTANSEDMENRIEGNRIVDLQYVGEILENGCAFCGIKPQLLSERRIGFLSIFKVKCKNCGNVTSLRKQKGKKNGRGIEINQMAVMGTLHSGLGASYLESLMASIEVPSLSEQGYTRVENCTGEAIEQEAAENCRSAITKEKLLSKEAGLTGGSVSMDQSWQKRGIAMNS